jgi:predicted GH43/DUF377 family glycosyl hydrolase
MNRILTAVILLCMFASTAQVQWKKYPDPVLRRSAFFPDWKGIATADPFVMIDNDTLKMWYSGSGWRNEFDDCPHVRMGYAWSVDGIYWNEFAGNPVLDISNNLSDFDADGVETPTVLKNISAPASRRYELWYAGRNARCNPVNDHQFGYAYSPDGIHWTKYPNNPVMSAGNTTAWYNTFISGPSVIFENGIYKMWFAAPDAIANGQPTDGKGNIGYTTSIDGITWAIATVPVLIAEGASVAEPSVLKIGNRYHMFYSTLKSWDNENFQVGYATSDDGINWNRRTEPVLKVNTKNQWDSYWASHPCVLYDSAIAAFRMWYTGRDKAELTDLDGYFWDIGYAQSNNFEKSFRISPVPADQNLYVELNGEWSDSANFNIYNSLGSLVVKCAVKNNETINIAAFKNGFYFIGPADKSCKPLKFIKRN